MSYKQESTPNLELLFNMRGVIPCYRLIQLCNELLDREDLTIPKEQVQDVRKTAHAKNGYRVKTRKK